MEVEPCNPLPGRRSPPGLRSIQPILYPYYDPLRRACSNLMMAARPGESWAALAQESFSPSGPIPLKGIGGSLLGAPGFIAAKSQRQRAGDFLGLALHQVLFRPVLAAEFLLLITTSLLVG